MALASPKSLDPGTGGGGSVQPVTPPAAASESVAAGGSLAPVTFSAFTDPGSRIASYSATRKNIVGSATISGSGLGAYSISGAADGEVITIELDALDSGGDVLATAVYTGTIAAASDGPSTIVDFSGCDDYDFLTQGGTGGSGGDGAHTLSDGSVWELLTFGTGATVCRIVSGELEYSSPDTNNAAWLRTDLGGEWATRFVRGVVTAQADSTASSAVIKTSESSAFTGNVNYDHQLLFLGGTASSQTARFRFCNSATTFNNYHDIAGADLASGNSFRFMVDEGNMGAISGGENGATMPTWKEADMGSMDADVRSSNDSWRRYLFIFCAARHVKLSLTISQNR